MSPIKVTAASAQSSTLVAHATAKGVAAAVVASPPAIVLKAVASKDTRVAKLILGNFYFIELPNSDKVK